MNDRRIFPHHLPFFLQRQIDALFDGPSTSITQVQTKAEIEAICFALKQMLGNKANAARLLGIHRTLLYKKCRNTDWIQRQCIPIYLKKCP